MSAGKTDIQHHPPSPATLDTLDMPLKRKAAMPKPLERNLQLTALRKLKALRARDNTLTYRKRHGTNYGVAGDPDLYGVWRGIAWEVELKAPGEQPTKLQAARLLEWLQAGAICRVIDTAEDFDLFMDYIQTLAQLRS